MDKTASFSLSWVDALIAILLFVGIMRGRKRGMSEELLDIIKWLVIVIAAAVLHQPLGHFLKQLSFCSLLYCYIMVYGAVMIFAFLLFSFLKRTVGGRLLGTDTFGNAEYYLGMGAGFFRYACIVLVGMAFLNARYYSPTEVQAKVKYQQDNFGSSFFLTLPDLQKAVFAESLSGRVAHEYLQVILIQPTPGNDAPPEDKKPRLGKRREDTFDEILERKKKRLDQWR
jgi:uncharacterized membrane protein required for colicin V production